MRFLSRLRQYSFPKTFRINEPVKGLAEAEARIQRVLETQDTYLSLNDLRLTVLPDSLARLKHLRVLHLCSNMLAALPECIGELTELTEIVVWDNQLTALPKSMRQLGKLSALFLEGNKLTSLPEWLRNLPSLSMLHLSGNDLNLPPEVLSKAKPAEIFDYYFRIHTESKHPLNEAKLILLGRGEVGKTCLVNRLVHDKFASTSMTRGIAITQWLVTS